MFRTYDKKLNKTVIVLRPGEYYATVNGEVISTTVGSCIATCIFDEKHKIAGMNHFMLPGAVNPQDLLKSEVGRYGMFAMELLIGELIKMGGDRKDVKAKFFGGGEVIKFRKSDGDIPQANIDFARKFMELENIPVLGEDVGGNYGRKILLFTDTNRVFVKQLTSIQAIAPIREVEESYKANVFRKRLDESKITLF